MRFDGHVAVVRSTHENYQKEKMSFVKSNTCRALDKTEQKVITSGRITHIRIYNEDIPSLFFEKRITDITPVDMYPLLDTDETLYIISWG